MSSYKRSSLLFGLLLLGLPLCVQAQDAWERVQKTGELRWCGDTTGGAPYVFPDEKDPKHIIGFEVDLMNTIGERLHVTPKLIDIQWDQLVPALGRGDCDLIVNGLEITEDRKKVIDFSIPYFIFSEQFTVRKSEDRYGTLAGARGHRVGTLSASLAESLLKQDPQITPVAYPSAVEAYKDLEIGRVDAVLMDDIIAAWYAGPNPKLFNVPKTLGESLYGMGVRKDSPKLKEQMNGVLRQMVLTGELKRLYVPWHLWTRAQHQLAQRAHEEAEGRQEQKPWIEFIPLLIKGAGMTIVLSIFSMALAVFIGGAICYGRLFGPAPARWFCNGYIEVIRGTPLLIQLFLLYYGLPNLGIQLPAIAAAILGMGFNYAAYEAEIYRSAYLAVPRGQMDAARSIGMTLNQALRHIMVPQAFRVALAPSTNDFIALFKDTSLVSIITVSELTRAYTEASTTTYRFLELGLTTAALYFAMSYPLALWSRSLEKKRHAAFH